jgi:hypothetical protein
VRYFTKANEIQEQEQEQRGLSGRKGVAFLLVEYVVAQPIENKKKKKKKKKKSC